MSNSVLSTQLSQVSSTQETIASEGHTDSLEYSPQFGASARDLWRIYKGHPENSCVDLKFFYDGQKEPVKCFQCIKSNDNTHPESYVKGLSDCKDVESKIYQFLGVYGLNQYRLSLNWDFGFGNAVLIRISRPNPEMHAEPKGGENP